MGIRLMRGLLGIVGWIGIVGYYVLTRETATRPPLQSTLIFFSYFTILTNILVALALTAPAVAPNGRLGRWFSGESIRAAIAMYIAAVGIIYHALLASTVDPQGALLVVDVILHTVMPVVFVLDWLMFVRKGRVRWTDPVRWLFYPFVYGVWSAVHGQMSGWYPYWFIDISSLGWGPAIMNFCGLLLVFLALGLATVALDLGLSRFGRGDRSLIPG